MIDKLKNWFRERISGDEATPTQNLRGTGAHAVPRPAPRNEKVPRPQPEYVAADEDLSGTIESNGPGKNVLIRNKFVREDTGTHETLKILDDSIVDSGEEQGLDPYNTGGFDRSKNWERRFSK
jgi:hypothetical protein